MIHSDATLANVAPTRNMICSAVICEFDAVPYEPDLDTPHGRLEWARLRARYDDKAKFARSAGIHPTTYRAYENGQNGFAKLAADFAKRLGVTAEWLLEGGAAPTGSAPEKAEPLARVDRAPDIPPARDTDQGEMAIISSLDLSFSMGPGRNIDDYIEETQYTFDLAWIRAITRTETSRLRVARGIGQSMFPTLQSGDQVLIDTTQRTLNMIDKVWAISIHNAAGIKRLRNLGNGKVLVKSDNPAEGDPFEVDAQDLTIVGRVIWFGREL